MLTLLLQSLHGAPPRKMDSRPVSCRYAVSSTGQAFRGNDGVGTIPALAEVYHGHLDSGFRRNDGERPVPVPDYCARRLLSGLDRLRKSPLSLEGEGWSLPRT